MTNSDASTDADQEEFEARYREHYSMVYSRLLTRTGGDAGRAENLAAEAFTRAWEQRAQFDGRNYGGWVSTIARNRLVDEVRSSEFTKTTATDMSAIDDLHDTSWSWVVRVSDRSAKGNDPADDVSDRDLVKYLSRSLTEEQRGLLTQRYLVDGSNGDVAEQVRTSEQHARDRTRYAVKAARSALGVEPATPAFVPNAGVAEPAQTTPTEETLWSIDRIAEEYGWQGSGARSFVARRGVDPVAQSVSRGHARLYDPDHVRAAHQNRTEHSTGTEQKAGQVVDQNTQPQSNTGTANWSYPLSTEALREARQIINEAGPQSAAGRAEELADADAFRRDDPFQWEHTDTQSQNASNADADEAVSG